MSGTAALRSWPIVAFFVGTLAVTAVAYFVGTAYGAESGVARAEEESTRVRAERTRRLETEMARLPDPTETVATIERTQSALDACRAELVATPDTGDLQDPVEK